MAKRKAKRKVKVVAHRKQSAKKKSSRGRGRPEGSKGTLPHGAVRAIKAIKRSGGYSEEVLNHPDLKDAFDLIDKVLKGTVTGRYVGDRMRAATMKIEMTAGRLKTKHEADVSETLADLLAGVVKKQEPQK